MKLIAGGLLVWILASHQTLGQHQPTAKLYFYCLPATSLTLTQAPNQKIKIGKCTLLETNLDRVGIELSREKIIYLHFDLGKTYYFQRILSSLNTVQARGVLLSSTEYAFWLNAYFSEMGTYRHYYLDQQSGLRLLEETK